MTELNDRIATNPTPPPAAEVEMVPTNEHDHEHVGEHVCCDHQQDEAQEPVEETRLGEMVSELTRHVSVEAAAPMIALYTPRTRSGSTSTMRTNRSRSFGPRARATSNAAARVNFPDTVVEQERLREKRTLSRGVGASEKPDLPRIDSEKTLAPDVFEEDEDEVETLAKHRSNDSGVASPPTKAISFAEALNDQDLPPHKAESCIECEACPQCPEDAMEEICASMSRTRKILLGFVMMLEVVISSMNSNAVVLTIPTMAADLGVGQLESQWVSSAYSLAFGCGLLFAGRLADIFGRRWLFLGGLAGCVVFSIISGVVRSLVPLCVVRALGGLALAVATPAGFGIIGVTFRGEPERTIAFAVFGLGNPVGASVGMLVGGGVAGINAHGWQYLYFVLGGLAVIPLALGFFVIPREPPREDKVDRRVDWLGGFLITAALCLFIFSITQSGVAGWNTPYIPALLVVSVVFFVAFAFWERYVERRGQTLPIAKLSLFTRDGAKISIIMLCAFCPFVAIAGWVYLVSLFYQEYLGMSALGNAIHTLPASLCGVVAALAVMYIVPRVRAPFVLMAGGFLSGLACLLFAVEPEGTTYWACQFISMLLLPFGADLTVGIGSILMSNLCEDDEQSVAGALFQTATQVASALGICISSLVSNNVYQQTGNYHTGLRHAFGMTTAWSWAVVILAAVFLRNMGLAKHVGNGRAVH